MNDTQIKNRAKLAVKRALTQPTISGQDLAALVAFANRDLAELKGESLNQFELSVLGAYAIQFN
jgi:alpha-D-ribose 1-methylphosphonate 5-triphosphate synthase subunit PhnI